MIRNRAPEIKITCSKARELVSRGSGRVGILPAPCLFPVLDLQLLLSVSKNFTDTFQLFRLPAGGSKNIYKLTTTTKAPTSVKSAVVAPWQFWNTSWLNISVESILKLLLWGQQGSSASILWQAWWRELEPQNLRGGRRDLLVQVLIQVFALLAWDKGWPWTPDSHTSTFPALELQAWATKPWLRFK